MFPPTNEYHWWSLFATCFLIWWLLSGISSVFTDFRNYFGLIWFVFVMGTTERQMVQIQFGLDLGFDIRYVSALCVHPRKALTVHSCAWFSILFQWVCDISAALCVYGFLCIQNKRVQYVYMFNTASSLLHFPEGQCPLSVPAGCLVGRLKVII